MPGDEVAILNRKRGAIKHKFTNFSNYLAQVQRQLEKGQDIDKNVAEICIRLNNFEGLWDEFEAIQIEIECLTTDECIEEQYQLRTSYYDIYTKNVVLGKMLIKQNKEQSEDSDESHLSRQSVGRNAIGQCTMERIIQQIKLPIIELPKFNGNFNHWLEFKDTFESLIHNNESIVSIQKFHYLKASLVGDALKLIQSIDFTSQNYIVAWQLICERFNNKRLLVQNHIKSIFEINSVTKESARSIRNLVGTIFKHLRVLETLGQPVQHWDAVLIYIIVAKLDKPSVREWERGKGAVESPTLNSLKTFLNDRADFLETFELNHSNKSAEGFKIEHKRSAALLGINTNLDKVRKCNFCRKDHLITQCKEFINLGISERLQKIRQLKLCLNCLCYGHWYTKCRARPCAKCSKKHHVLLHLNEVSSHSVVTTEDGEHEKEPNTPQLSLISSQNRRNAVLLSTIVIYVEDNNGSLQKCRAILDNGSMSNLITEEFANKLQVPQSRSNISIVGINQTELELKSTCNLKLKSRVSEFETDITCIIMPNKIADNLPVTKVDISSWKIPTSIKLADPNFNIPSKIDMLIGAQLFWNLLLNESHVIGKRLPMLHNTVFGWVVSGTISQNMVKTYCNFVRLTNQELDNALTKFWDLEEIHSGVSILNTEENICESHFVKNYSQNSDGRFVVRIPLKLSRNELGESQQMATKRFLNLERKLTNDSNLKELYSEFMKEYLELGHMEISKLNDTSKLRSYFLPHHAIWRPDNVSTKLRVVFDGSAVTDSGLSLNDIQFKGPSCQNDIVDILFRFRQHRFVVCADIEKMYRQILVHEDDRSLQQIIWRFNPDDPLCCYTLNTVTYGTASAPYLAIRCLKQLGSDTKDSYPRASQIISDDFYVDDLITGFDNINDAVVACNDVAKILNDAGFHLRKWSSNCAEILASKTNVDNDTHLLLNDTATVKTLGLMWNRNQDTISFCTKDWPEDVVTKRAILSSIAKLYDPLGLVSPCIILVKIMIQKLWSLKLDWDTPIPIELEHLWVKFRNTLPLLNKLELPRHVFCNNAVVTELHGFSDASSEAYAAVVYLRSVDKDGNVHVILIGSKTKVAPLKQKLTIPKLELSGALLLARLTNRILNALTVNNIQCFMWCDSQIVLAWIKNTTRSLPRFEANRVAEIHKLSQHYVWSYVSTKDNPADIASRGMLPNVIENCSIWWSGPHFLNANNEAWPIPQSNIESSISCLVTDYKFKLFNRFSSFTKLIRVIAYCLRFHYNLRSSKTNRRFGYLTVVELNESSNVLIKLSQNESFANEIELFVKGKTLHKGSTLTSLAPFLDDNGILRVGGRLRHSKLRFDSKHPILLSGKHSLTKLIIQSEHKKLLHAGPQLLLATIRQTYWPTSGMSTVKRVTRNCITCYKFKPQCIYSDNGTNFLGAKRELKALSKFLINSNDHIATICANDNITWKFIPPRAPHFGGIWESAVKSCKYHLLRVIGNAHLTYEEFYTILVQIEATLNSRPMYSLSSDPNDLLPLTPSHFLIGKPLTMVADPSLAELRVNKLFRLQLLQSINQQFWKFWSREYISTLHRRNKWNIPSANILRNSLVLLQDENLPPCKWLTGRVVELHPGSDKIVRVVSVKTPHGVLKRPVCKLCLLPLPERHC